MADKNNAPAGCSGWLLAFESSTPFGGVALANNGVVVDEISLEEGLRHGRDLAPAAERLLERHGIGPADLAATAVSAGPGSYTGIRVGVMTAKALAYGSGRRLVAVSSLAALAASASFAGTAKQGDLVMPMLDARRDEVYAGLYRVAGDEVDAMESDRALAPEECRDWLQLLFSQGIAPLAVGSALETYRAVLGAFASSPPSAPASPRAAAVARLGWRKYLREEFADPLSLQPVYLRRGGGDGGWTRDVLITGK